MISLFMERYTSAIEAWSILPRTHLYKSTQEGAVAAFALVEGEERRHRSLLAAYVERRAGPGQHSLLGRSSGDACFTVVGTCLVAAERFTYSQVEPGSKRHVSRMAILETESPEYTPADGSVSEAPEQVGTCAGVLASSPAASAASSRLHAPSTTS